MVFNNRKPKEVKKISPEEEKKIIEKMGGIEILAQSHEQSEKDHIFLDKHLEEWRKLYPDHWVAVFEEELIVVEKDIFKFLAIIKEKNIPQPYSLVSSHLSTKRIRWILSRR